MRVSGPESRLFAWISWDLAEMSRVSGVERSRELRTAQAALWCIQGGMSQLSRLAGEVSREAEEMMKSYCAMDNGPFRWLFMSFL